MSPSDTPSENQGSRSQVSYDSGFGGFEQDLGFGHTRLSAAGNFGDYGSNSELFSRGGSADSASQHADSNGGRVGRQNCYHSDNDDDDDEAMDGDSFEDDDIMNGDMRAPAPAGCGISTGRGSGSSEYATMHFPQTQSSPMGQIRGFTAPNVAHKPSRASGFRIEPAINSTPSAKKSHGNLVPNNSMSEAALLKRGLTRGDASFVPKRASGPNDPENVAIVNMFENDKLRWTVIADKLNMARVATGRNPSFTPTSVHNRYNRNAPVLFAAEGRQFVPIVERNAMRKMGQNYNDGLPAYFWTPENDKVLIECLKQWEKEKWEHVASLFNARTNASVSARACASRTGLI